MYVCLAKGKELGGFVDKIIRIDLLRKKAWNGIKELKIEKYMLRKIHDANQQSLAKQTTSNQGSMRMTLRRIHPCGNETHGLDAWQMNHRSSSCFLMTNDYKYFELLRRSKLDFFEWNRRVRNANFLRTNVIIYLELKEKLVLYPITVYFYNS